MQAYIKSFLALITLGVSFQYSLSQSLEMALKQTKNEQFETAEATFKQLIEKNPTDGKLHFYLGENYFKNEQFSDAKKMYEKALSINATTPLCFVGVGKYLWYEGKTDAGQTNFFKALSTSKSKDVEILNKIAEVYIKAPSKNLEEAKKLLDKAMKIDARNFETNLLYGDWMLEKNNGSEAINYYKKAAEIDPKSSLATLRIGKLFARARNYTLGLKYYKEAVELDPNFAPAYREQAEIYFLAGQYNNAVEKYKKFLELNNNLSARIRYAGFLLQAKKYDEVIEEGKSLIAGGKENVYLNRYMGYAYYERKSKDKELKKKDYTEGLSMMERFFSLAKAEDAKIIAQDYSYQGKLFLKNDKPDEGLAAINKALELKPNDADLVADVAKVFYKNKDYNRAIEFYSKKGSMEGGKMSANDNYALGRCYYFSKKFKEADSVFAKITKAKPDLPLGHLWRGRANSRIDSTNENWLAKDHYETFLAKAVEDKKYKGTTKKSYLKNLVEGNTYMGVYFMNQENYLEAKKKFTQIIELDPENENAKKFLDSEEAKKVKLPVE